MKEFDGKAIYKPKGKAGEYAEWACNFYVGCSVKCDYCFNKKGRGAAVLGGEKPTLKKSFRSEAHALDIFEKEMLQNKEELQKHGLFFSFTTDPMLPETSYLTVTALTLCMAADIPVKILTKKTGWHPEVINFLEEELLWKSNWKHRLAFGFTLTGHDELEQGASANKERIQVMHKIHNAGIKTFASIEPIIDLPTSLAMINLTRFNCDLYKIGLMSGVRYSKIELRHFVDMATKMYPEAKFYFKNTFLTQAGLSRNELPECCVGADYNMFNY